VFQSTRPASSFKTNVERVRDKFPITHNTICR